MNVDSVRKEEAARRQDRDKQPCFPRPDKPFRQEKTTPGGASMEGGKKGPPHRERHSIPSSAGAPMAQTLPNRRMEKNQVYQIFEFIVKSLPPVLYVN